MTKRTSTKTIAFRRPFVLRGFDEVLPAGAYSVETDEELLEGISFPVYRRTLSLIHLHEKTGHPGLTQTLSIDPKDLDAALKRDQAPEAIPLKGQLKKTTEQGQDAADCQAIDRAEDEGMIIHSV